LIKKIIITGIDSVGKTTAVSNIASTFKNVYVRKYPNDGDIKAQINAYYDKLIEGGADLHNETVRNIYRQIHDLYDRDFRLSFTVPSDTQLIVFDRYFVDNAIHSRFHGVYKLDYIENHFVTPDLVIMLKARDYMTYKKKFVLKGDENVREPAVLFHEVQPEFQTMLKDIQAAGKIKKYIIIQALTPDTDNKIREVIEGLLAQ